MKNEPMVDINVVAEFLGLPVATVRKWRVEGYGPTGYKVGRHVRYDMQEVRDWVKDQGEPTGPVIRERTLIRVLGDLYGKAVEKLGDEQSPFDVHSPFDVQLEMCGLVMTAFGCRHPEMAGDCCRHCGLSWGSIDALGLVSPSPGATQWWKQAPEPGRNATCPGIRESCTDGHCDHVWCEYCAEWRNDTGDGPNCGHYSRAR